MSELGAREGLAITKPMKGRVLYAEDDESDAFFMQRAFAPLKETLVLTVVADGLEAVEFLIQEMKAEPTLLPILIILDVKMPGLTGLEVLQWVRSHDKLTSVPVAMLTSSSEPRDIEFCRANGANAYFTKPSQSLLLSKIVTETLSALDAVPSDPRLDVQGNLL